MTKYRKNTRNLALESLEFIFLKKNNLIDYIKLHCELKIFHESYEDVRHGKRKPRPHTFT